MALYFSFSSSFFNHSLKNDKKQKKSQLVKSKWLADQMRKSTFDFDQKWFSDVIKEFFGKKLNLKKLLKN